MLNIDYIRGTGQGVINTATFNLEDEKQLILNIVEVYDLENAEEIVGHNIQIVTKDNRFGEEQLNVELSIQDSTDLIRIMQRLCRQIVSQKQPVVPV